jgi:hypothetical protein
MRRFIVGLAIAGLFGIALLTGAWGATVIQQGSGGPPNLVPQATESMTVRVHKLGGSLSSPVEPVDVSATEEGNVLAHYDYTSYNSPLAVDVLWDGEKFVSSELPPLPGVIYNTGIDVLLKADGTWQVTVLTEQKKVYLGNGKYGFKSGNEIQREAMPFLCPDNRYLKPCQGPEPECALTCAP